MSFIQFISSVDGSVLWQTSNMNQKIPADAIQVSEYIYEIEPAEVAPEPIEIPVVLSVTEEIIKKKEIKSREIRADFEASLAPNVLVNGTPWQSGFASALSLDGAMRIAETSGAVEVTLHDANHEGHTLSFDLAREVIIAIGSDYQFKFAKKQDRLKQIADISLDDEGALLKISVI
jgi:hypothetical protein